MGGSLTFYDVGGLMQAMRLLAEDSQLRQKWASKVGARSFSVISGALGSSLTKSFTDQPGAMFIDNWKLKLRSKDGYTLWAMSG